ncbi:unnamed protein product [Microthlaspi erraticum]|uniref:C2 domain-containing protein n=1 Tax=Microthlaspi erraticum TaxID=1685480 RepID=A0A6D2IUU3_9BRAS|nr:unnamed protein product [Microthlaspi erraticum]
MVQAENQVWSICGGRASNVSLLRLSEKSTAEVWNRRAAEMGGTSALTDIRNPVWNQNMVFVIAEPFEEPLILTVIIAEPFSRILTTTDAFRRG